MSKDLEKVIEEIDKRVVRLSDHAEKCKGVESKQYNASATTLVLLKMWINKNLN